MDANEQLNTILENGREKLCINEENWPPEVKRACDFLYDHIFNEILKVTWLMEECSIYNKSFHAKFAVCTGYYPKEFIRHHRIETSKEILSCAFLAGVSLTKVGVSVGYSSYSAFANAFEIYEGIAPVTWRNKKLTI